MKFTAGQIAELLNGEIVGDEEAVITHPGKIEDAGKGAITFLANPKYKKYLSNSEASAVLVPTSFQSENSIEPTLIKVENVYMALGKLLDSLGMGAQNPESISDNASIDKDTDLGENVNIGDYTVIQKNVEIGEGSTIFSQVYIGKNVKIGKNCKIYAGARIHHDTIIGDDCIIHSNAVIGSDGFGFAADGEGRYHKIPQIGKVVIQNKVEIGANVVIDRATMGETLISNGVKLDNLIQIAHNVTIRENTVIAAQAGIAGSSEIGKNVVLGGQAGIAGHISIADGTKIQAQSGVAADIDQENSRKYGSPALDYNKYLRSYAVFKQLPALKKEIEKLRNQLDELRSGEK